ncbi:MAG: divalent-cation tolerance protein CutA [Planctomycetia bacterium]|nr:divalent-cation tolerance protein CutA [Planctomycetia bacterium]
MSICVIQFTIDELCVGELIITTLLGTKQIACAQVTGPIQSHYWWEGEIQHTDEWRISLKTTLQNKERVLKTIREIHSYDVPEIEICETLEFDEKYARWIETECAGVR